MKADDSLYEERMDDDDEPPFDDDPPYEAEQDESEIEVPKRSKKDKEEDKAQMKLGNF